MRRFFEAYNARDEGALREMMSESFEFTSVFVAVEGATYRGRDAMTPYFRDLEETWEVFQLENVELFEGTEGVLAEFDVRGKGRSSGAEVSPAIAAIFTFADDGVAGLRTFMDREEARSAAGV